MKIILANPRGFCAGVDRAIEIVQSALDKFGAPIYVRHEVVHNRYVVDTLRHQGAVFVDELSQIPDGATVIFSAHGVSKAVRVEAKLRGLTIFDATCPLVTKVHMEVVRYSKRHQECFLIGHAGHPEVEGTLGQYESKQGAMYLIETVEDVASTHVKDPTCLAYVTQTTLSMDDTAKIIDALREKYPLIEGPKRDDICYATQNRQDAVVALSQVADVVLVIGSINSSNSNRLQELAQRHDKPAYLIDSFEELQPAWFEDKKVIGITAGASAPEVLVKKVIDALKTMGATSVEELPGVNETITFALPKVLRKRKLST